MRQVLLAIEWLGTNLFTICGSDKVGRIWQSISQIQQLIDMTNNSAFVRDRQGRF
jgi:hypothetical protein